MDGYIFMQINHEDLILLIFWARRYCDKHSTTSAESFNQIYRNIMEKNPLMHIRDKRDKKLQDAGMYWPYAKGKIG